MSQAQEKLINIVKQLEEMEIRYKERYKQLMLKVSNETNEMKKDMYKNELDDVKRIIRKIASVKVVILSMAELGIIDKDELQYAREELRTIAPELSIELLELL